MTPKFGMSRGFGARGLAAAAISALGISTAVVLTAGPALADPVKQTLNFTCSFPEIGSQPVLVDFESDLPPVIRVGEPTPRIPHKVTVRMTSAITNFLLLTKATDLHGSGSSDWKISVPEDPNLPVSVPLEIAKTAVPQSADTPWNIVLDGTAPQLSLSRPGELKITIDGLRMHLDPTKADGTEVWTGGKDVPCTKVPGQDAPFYSSSIQPPNPTPTPSPTPTPTPTTCEPTVDYVHHGVKGETVVKAANGKATLTGKAVTTVLCDEPRAIDLHLDPTRGDFQLFGFLPVTADMQLIPNAQTTSRSGSEVTIKSKVTTKLTSIKAFGSIPIGGGETCQTDTPSDLTLTSPSFGTYTGGTFTGEYELSSISDCGPLGPLFSGFIAGGGNTIKLDLAPQD